MPTDSNPFRTMHAQLLAQREARGPVPPTVTPRSRAALRAFLDQHTPSTRATDARNARMRECAAEREAFEATQRGNGDYTNPTYVNRD